MAGLSFLVTHGVAVWLAIVVLSLAFGAFAAWRLVDRAMRARARRVREAMGDASPAARADEAGKRVTLVGTLCAIAEPGEEARQGALAATVVPQGLELVEEATPKARSAAAGGAKLAIEVSGARVVLDGPFQVLAGSRETEKCIAKALGQTLLWDFAGQLGALPPRVFGVRTLSLGDKVIARGMLRHDPDPADAGTYREARALFALEPDHDDPDAKVIPLAYDGPPRPLARPRSRTALRALSAPLVALLALALVGEIAVRAGKPGADAIAAATPFRRADALRQLREGITLRSHTDGALVDRAVALDKLRGRCTEAVDDLFEHHRLEASAEMAAQCKDPWREGRARFALAEMERAAEAYGRGRERNAYMPYSLSEATAYVAANRWDRAGEALHALSKTWDDGPDARQWLECAALFADHKAGKADARTTLAARNESGGAGVCTLLWIDAQDAGEVPESAYRVYSWSRRETLDVHATAEAMKMERLTSPQPLANMARELNVTPAQLVFDPRAGVYRVPPGLAQATAARLEKFEGAPAALARAELLVRLATFESYFGEIGEADKRLDEADAALAKARAGYTDDEIAAFRRRVYGYYYTEGHYPTEEERAALFATNDLAASAMARYALGIRAGKKGLTEPKTDFGWWAVRELATARLAKVDGADAALAQLAQRDARDVNRKLWDYALAQDGPALTRRLEDKEMDGRGVVDFLGTQTALHDELARWVRWNYPAACSTCGVYPLANQIVSRRDAAVAAHAPDVEAETAETARRVRALLLRRDIAVVLGVMSALSPP